jgi:hypothetical protein
MPLLPLVDALILLGWSSLFVAFVQKAIYVTTLYRPKLFGMMPLDFVMLAIVCLLFALTLTGRAWLKAHEPDLLARRRRRALDRLEYDDVPVEEEDGAGLRAAASEAPRRSAAGH